MGLFSLIADAVEVVTKPVDIVEEALDLESVDLDIASSIRDEVTDTLRDLDE